MKAAHVVLIEDNRADVFLVKMALDKSGIPHSLTHYESGADAVPILCGPGNGNGALPDVILLDLNTPRIDGFEALRMLKECPRLAQVSIAVLSSSHSDRDRYRVETEGVRFIEKPSHLQEFLSTVGQAVKQMLQEIQPRRTTSPL